MDSLLKKEIINQRRQLEYLIESSNSLQNKEVISCSRKLDGLITKYQKNVLRKHKLAVNS